MLCKATPHPPQAVPLLPLEKALRTVGDACPFFFKTHPQPFAQEILSRNRRSSTRSNRNLLRVGENGDLYQKIQAKKETAIYTIISKQLLHRRTKYCIIRSGTEKSLKSVMYISAIYRECAGSCTNGNEVLAANVHIESVGGLSAAIGESYK